MSNPLRALTESLRRDVLSRKHRAFYAEARERAATLGQYESTEKVLGALACERADHYEERERLTRALLAEHRRHTHAIWSELLIVAYYPMLSRLRYRLVSERLTGDDLDQLVLMAFLRAIDDVPFETKADRIALRLRQRTARLLFQQLGREHNGQRLLEELEEHHHERPQSEGDSGADSFEHRLVLGELCRAASDDLPESALVVLRATVLEQECLHALAKRLCDGNAQEQPRVYQRLKRQRSRALSRLREVVTTAPETFRRSA